jgi:hypothetical protein
MNSGEQVRAGHPTRELVLVIGWGVDKPHRICCLVSPSIGPVQRTGSEMGQTARAFAVPVIDRHDINRLETHFVAADIYRRDDLSVRQAKLARIVSSNIIPRLLRLHTEVVPDAPPVEVLIESLAPSSADISGLADIVLGNNLEAAAAYVTVLRDRGLSMETLFIELLEPTARFLGEMWDCRSCLPSLTIRTPYLR